MNLCREHGNRSRDQRPGAKDGGCNICPTVQRRQRRPKKDHDADPSTYIARKRKGAGGKR